ncbi:EF-hand domain-containing protein [Paludibaculum fermentans]|uniref:EF-hand domain-containing protein n=2 Tax=Paludibaculum fermentans TaxID=1473598 RepID=A0A7S7NUA5_PALFE|nr:EF-hand domain-containing protein [Paludibaculum fermentans]
MFEKVDVNRDGKITKDELSNSIESDSSASSKKLSADQIFQVLDSGGKGYITKQDAADGLEKMAQKMEQGGGAPPADGGKQGSGGSGSGGGSSSSTTSSSSSSEVYDPKDTNQDGKVSMQEEVAYALSQYTKAEKLQTAPQETSTTTYA